MQDDDKSEVLPSVVVAPGLLERADEVIREPDDTDESYEARKGLFMTLRRSAVERANSNPKLSPAASAWLEENKEALDSTIEWVADIGSRSQKNTGRFDG